MRRFIEFPYGHYRRDHYWVAPLRSDQKQLLDPSKHPFYAHADLQCFLAVSKGQVCGRIAGIVDHTYNSATGEKLGHFGFFESIDSEPVATGLLRAVAEWHGSRGLVTMRGPFSPSINYESGLLIDGFHSSPCIMMTYNPPYYERLFARAGLRPAMDLYAYRLRNENVCSVPLTRASRISAEPRVQIRPGRRDRFDEEVQAIGKLFNTLWRSNWGATPITPDEMRHFGRQLKPLIRPELVLFAEVEGETIGFALAVPDINRALKAAKGSLFPLGLFRILFLKRRIKALRILALAVAERYRRSGVAAQLYLQLIQRGRALGYTEAECSWVLENNRTMNRSLAIMGAERYKTYRVYESRISELLAAR